MLYKLLPIYKTISKEIKFISVMILIWFYLFMAHFINSRILILCAIAILIIHSNNIGNSIYPFGYQSK